MSMSMVPVNSDQKHSQPQPPPRALPPTPSAPASQQQQQQVPVFIPLMSSHNLNQHQQQQSMQQQQQMGQHQNMVAYSDNASITSHASISHAHAAADVPTIQRAIEDSKHVIGNRIASIGVDEQLPSDELVRSFLARDEKLVFGGSNDRRLYYGRISYAYADQSPIHDLSVLPASGGALTTGQMYVTDQRVLLVTSAVQPKKLSLKPLVAVMQRHVPPALAGVASALPQPPVAGLVIGYEQTVSTADVSEVFPIGLSAFTHVSLSARTNTAVTQVLGSLPSPPAGGCCECLCGDAPKQPDNWVGAAPSVNTQIRRTLQFAVTLPPFGKPCIMQLDVTNQPVRSVDGAMAAFEAAWRPIANKK